MKKNLKPVDLQNLLFDPAKEVVKADQFWWCPLLLSSKAPCLVSLGKGGVS